MYFVLLLRIRNTFFILGRRMLKSIIQLIIVGLMLIDVVCILLAKIFIPQKNVKNNYDREELLKKYNLIVYAIFALLATILILINLF